MDAEDARSDSLDPFAAAVGIEPPTLRLERRVVLYWLLVDALRTAALIAFLHVGQQFAFRERLAPPWLPNAVEWVSYALAAACVVMPPLSYAVWRYGISDAWLSMRYGVLFREDRRVPVARMQHVDLLRGPVERLFSLATLVVYTAGNEGSAFRVPGLSPAQARQMRDRILRLRGHDGT